MTDASLVESLVRKIELAFPTHPVPEPAEIYTEDDEAESYLPEVAARTWPELRFENDLEASARLGFMRSRSFAYYLPAYLKTAIIVSECPGVIHALQQYLYPPTSVFDRKLTGFPSGEGAHSGFDERVESLTTEQKHIVACVFKFLEMKADGEGVLQLGFLPSFKEAVDKYWHKYVNQDRS
ncbi:MAG: hypothetical protein EON58_02565 [Alphaproteobacteria bacterium]|nr:MAG: hypothetical protein EON58_02565 [Alphaproteobacteria bacterium]